MKPPPDDPRIVPDHTAHARWLVYLTLPVGLLSIALVITMLLAWGTQAGLCGTWLRATLPYCT